MPRPLVHPDASPWTWVGRAVDADHDRSALRYLEVAGGGTTLAGTDRYRIHASALKSPLGVKDGLHRLDLNPFTGEEAGAFPQWREMLRISAAQTQAPILVYRLERDLEALRAKLVEACRVHGHKGSGLFLLGDSSPSSRLVLSPYFLRDALRGVYRLHRNGEMYFVAGTKTRPYLLAADGADERRRAAIAPVLVTDKAPRGSHFSLMDHLEPVGTLHRPADLLAPITEWPLRPS